MNFLLHMLGRATGFHTGLRPTPRQHLLRHAAQAAAAGDFSASLTAYQTLTQAPTAGSLDILICAQLHLLCGEHVESAINFADGIARLHRTRAADTTASTALELLFQQSDELLSQGHCIEAADIICRARALIEVLLAAESGLYVAGAGIAPLSALQALVHLSDLSLRLLARTQIADQLAVALRHRQIDHTLAPWATSSHSVQELLESHFSALESAADATPSHAENHYRLGLLASALGDTRQAACAFKRVLTLHPHHMSSAARLALAEVGNAADILRRALTIPPATLELFAGLVHVAADPAAFGAAADKLCNGHSPSWVRANLNFALAEVAAVPAPSSAATEGQTTDTRRAL